MSPTVREGYAKMTRELRVDPVLPGPTRLMLWLLAVSALALGVQAEFTPRAFYDDFPFGRGWVAMDGRYNEHLIRDFGALNLAIFVLTVGALFVGTRAISRVAAGFVDRVLGAASRVPPASPDDGHARRRQGRHGGVAVASDPRRDGGVALPPASGPARQFRSACGRDGLGPGAGIGSSRASRPLKPGRRRPNTAIVRS